MEQHIQKDPLVHNTMTIDSAMESCKSINGNKKGRPCQSKRISFCPQPKSIVSQLLNEIKSMRSNKNAANSTKVNDCLYIHTVLANKYFPEIQPQLINETEVLDYYNNLPDVETTTESEDLKTPNHDSVKVLLREHDNDTKSWNMELLRKSKSYKSKRKNNKKKRCNNTGQLQDHLSTLEDVYFTCDYTECTYNTKVMSNLLKHKRVHTNERPYLCDQCTFRSNFVNSLKVHRRIHTTERPYCCEQCGHRCNSISNLKKHCLHKHKNASEVVK